MSDVLTTASTITCDSGTVSTSASGKLTVSGSKVLTSGDVSSWTISGCLQTNVNAGEVQCKKVTSQSGGTSQKLTAGGSPVVLSTLTGTTNGSPKNTLSASAGQTRLTAS